MDGTLVDSAAGVAAAWEAIAKEYPEKGIDVKDILSCESLIVTSFGAYNLVVFRVSWYQDR